MLLVFAVLSGGGCAGTSREPDLSGTEPPPLSEDNRYLSRGTLEAVEIRGHPRATVMETVESVATAAGLARVRSDAKKVTFERPATRSEQAAYGNWMGEDVRFRLCVECVLQGTDRFLVQSRCYVVREAGSYAEDEQSLARRKARGYEHLLAEVWRRLNQE
jgi:hypothetical protein